MASFARRLELDDLPSLEPLDARYAKDFMLEPLVSRSSLSFYQRTGHSFVAMRAEEIRGFILAQTIWNGQRPCIFMDRLVVLDDDLDARLALVEALTKSAYDSAVYDLRVLVPAHDEALAEALAEKAYYNNAMQVYERVLGSRGTKEAVT